MNLQSIINSRLGIGLALTLGRTVPPRIGNRVAQFFADWISGRKDSMIVQVMRANQWVVHRENITTAQLDQSVREAFRKTARGIYSHYHYMDKPDALQRSVQYSPIVEEYIRKSQQGIAGLMIVSIHTAIFDFVLNAGVRRGFNALLLGLPNFEGGFEWQNKIRHQTGVKILPSSKSNFRLAIEHLKSGGTVVTGIDRPVPGLRLQPCFFGRPAALPVFHIQIALRAQVPIVVLAALEGPEGVYQVFGTDPIPLDAYEDRQTEIVANANKILSYAERYIEKDPTQWSIYHPVWPGAMDELSSMEENR